MFVVILFDVFLFVQGEWKISVFMLLGSFYHFTTEENSLSLGYKPSFTITISKLQIAIAEKVLSCD